MTEARLSPHQKILHQQQQICQSNYVLGFKVLFNFIFVLPSGENKYARLQKQISSAVEFKKKIFFFVKAKARQNQAKLYSILKRDFFLLVLVLTEIQEL